MPSPRVPSDSTDLLGEILSYTRRLERLERGPRDETEIALNFPGVDNPTGVASIDGEGNVIHATSREFKGQVYPFEYIGWTVYNQFSTTFAPGDLLHVEFKDLNAPGWGDVRTFDFDRLDSSPNFAFGDDLNCKIGLGDNGNNAGRDPLALIEINITHEPVSGPSVTTLFAKTGIYQPPVDFFAVVIDTILHTGTNQLTLSNPYGRLGSFIDFGL